MGLTYSFEEYVSDLSGAATAAEMFARCADMLAQLGYTKVIFSALDDPGLSRLAPKNGTFLRNLEAWRSYYATIDGDTADPGPHLLRRRVRVFAWNHLPQITSLSVAQRAYLRDLEDLGLHNGLTVALGEGRAAFGLSTETRSDLPRSEVPLLQAIGNQFYFSLRALPALIDPEADAGEALTGRERDVLVWLAAGKTDAEIAQILTISSSTVDGHLRQIFRKLEASNRVTAVIKGLKRGYIAL